MVSGAMVRFGMLLLLAGSCTIGAEPTSGATSAKPESGSPAASGAPAAGPATHSPSPISIDMSASPAQVNVGQEVIVTLAYRWPADWTPTAEPDPTPAFADEFVTAAPPPRTLHTGEGEQRIWTISLRARRSGTWSLPRPAFIGRGPAGSAEARAPEVLVQVGIDSAPAHLAAARALWVRPRSIEAETGRWWPWLASIAALVGAGSLLLWRRRTAAPPPTPRELFTQDWQRSVEAGDGKEAGARLSLALRRYTGALWSFDGPGSTTREVGVQLRAQLQGDEHRALLRLLEDLDNLRWSADDLPTAAIQPLHDGARQWVDAVERRLDAEAKARQEQAKTTGVRT